ncbi:uncharacterized protein LOC112638390 isoform X1 [Camponotus floridanus]|uniref:uncharacterized protein LOC112638390 isoform X1 n=1 Tax=Camponotus floridanus TaxID=104421 RepID=UPI000DC67A8C|nr:uncharacterized protein LOC112638390 isoform X1 [Camponotus floridanus]
MQFFKSSIYIILHLYALYSNVYCDETDTLDDVTPLADDLENIYSFFYKSEKDSEKPTAQAKMNDQFAIQSYNYKELNGQSQEAIFYKRLITIMLSNLAIQRIDDKVIGILNIEASSSQFEYLQNFVNGQGSIREVDRILDNVIKQPDYTMYHYMADMSRYLLSEHLMNYLLIMKEHWDITIISLIVISSFMILRRQRWSRGLIIFLLIDVIFIISFFITWWQLIQEAEIKLMAAQAQFVEMPIACQPHKMGLWDKMVASFSSTNDCEKYYESIMTNPRLQVTPAYALTYFLSTVILQPVSYCGLVISEFIDNATSKLNFVYKIPIMIILYSAICLLIILVPFFLFGGSINFGIGPFLNFGIKAKTNSNEKQERIERIYEDISPKKKLKDSKKMKQILSKQQDKADPAGGDAGIDKHQLKEKCIKCKCENKDADKSIEYKKKEEKDSDC